MADYNTKGEPNLRRLLKDIQNSITALEVVDPRLEMLRRQLLDLSIIVDELQERVRQLEKHEDIAQQVAWMIVMAAFVVVVVLVFEYI